MSTQLLNYNLIKTTKNTKLIPLFLFLQVKGTLLFRQDISILIYSVDQCRVLVFSWAIQQWYLYTFSFQPRWQWYISFTFLLSTVCEFIRATVPPTTSDFLLYTPWIFENNFLFYYSFLFFDSGGYYFSLLQDWRRHSHEQVNHIHIYIFSYIHFLFFMIVPLPFLCSSCEDQGGCCTRYSYYVLYVRSYVGTTLVLSPS